MLVRCSQMPSLCTGLGVSQSKRAQVLRLGNVSPVESCCVRRVPLLQAFKALGPSYLSGDFRTAFPHMCFTTGHEKPSVDKVATFQSRQDTLEAVFDNEACVSSEAASEPPRFLARPPFDCDRAELRTCGSTAVSKEAGGWLHETSQRWRG